MTANIADMGNMGEAILENILQDCGMTKDRDYKTQYTDKNDEGQSFRPDVVIFLPDKRNIIIDSKVPMKDWYEFQNTDDIKMSQIKLDSKEFEFISTENIKKLTDEAKSKYISKPK